MLQSEGCVGRGVTSRRIGLRAAAVASLWGAVTPRPARTPWARRAGGPIVRIRNAAPDDVSENASIAVFRGFRAFPAVFLAALCIPAVAEAQRLPAGLPSSLTNAPSAIRAATDRTRTEAAGPLGPESELRFTSQTPPANAREIRFVLRGVELSGGTLYDTAELSPLWDPALDQEIDLAEVFALAARLQNRYRDDGYLFTRVVVPAQRIDDGRVRFEIIEATLTSVTIETPGLPLGPMRELAERTIAPLQGLSNPTLAQIERTLLLLNDIPGVTRAAAVPKMGEGGRGGVDLHINMEREAVGFTLFADNRQSPLIGRGLIGGVLALNSWSPAGDSTIVSFFNSADVDDPFPDDFQERHTIQVEHRRILDPSGLWGSFRGLYAESAPGDRVAIFDITSDQTELTATMGYPAVRSRALKLDVFGGFQTMSVNSLTPAIGGLGQDLVTDDRLRVAFAGMRAEYRDPYGSGEGRGELRAGLDVLNASPKGSPELSRQDGDPQFFSLRAELSRTQPFDDRLSFWAKGWAQAADRPLLASEEFAIGGPELGRAYHPSELSGDLGAGLSMEVRYADQAHWGDVGVPYEFYAYGDMAEVRNLDGGAPVHASLVSAGIGVRAQLPGALSLNLELARPINRPLAHTQRHDWRVLFSASKDF